VGQNRDLVQERERDPPDPRRGASQPERGHDVEAPRRHQRGEDGALDREVEKVSLELSLRRLLRHVERAPDDAPEELLHAFHRPDRGQHVDLRRTGHRRARGRLGRGHRQTGAVTEIVGSCRTGKLTELAMKQTAWARSCSARAFSASVPGATETLGWSTTSVNLVTPFTRSIFPYTSSS